MSLDNRADHFLIQDIHTYAIRLISPGMEKKGSPSTDNSRKIRLCASQKSWHLFLERPTNSLVSNVLVSIVSLLVLIVNRFSLLPDTFNASNGLLHVRYANWIGAMNGNDWNLTWFHADRPALPTNLTLWSLLTDFRPDRYPTTALWLPQSLIAQWSLPQ